MKKYLLIAITALIIGGHASAAVFRSRSAADMERINTLESKILNTKGDERVRLTAEYDSLLVVNYLLYYLEIPCADKESDVASIVKKLEAISTPRCVAVRDRYMPLLQQHCAYSVDLTNFLTSEKNRSMRELLEADHPTTDHDKHFMITFNITNYSKVYNAHKKDRTVASIPYLDRIMDQILAMKEAKLKGGSAQTFIKTRSDIVDQLKPIDWSQFNYQEAPKPEPKAEPKPQPQPEPAKPAVSQSTKPSSTMRSISETEARERINNAMSNKQDIEVNANEFYSLIRDINASAFGSEKQRELLRAAGDRFAKILMDYYNKHRKALSTTERDKLRNHAQFLLSNNLADKKANDLRKI